MNTITISPDLCQRCHRCVTVCPSAVFTASEGGVPVVARADGCIACGHCVDVCPPQCIAHSAFPANSIHPVRRELLPSPEQLLELIKSRRSNRTITTKAVPKAALADILEAAAYAPTAENSRRVTVTVIDSDGQLQRIEDSTMRFFLFLEKLLMNRLMRGITKWLLPSLYGEAPELLRFQRRWKAGEKPCLCNATTLLVFSAPVSYDFAADDCNLAYQNASLMAEAHGISQVYMGLVKTALKYRGNRHARQLLGLPRHHKLCAMMALGVPAFRYQRYVERFFNEGMKE